VNDRPLKIVLGDQARGPGDEPAPRRVLHQNRGGRAELLPADPDDDTPVGLVWQDPDASQIELLPEDWDAETAETDSQDITDRPVDQDDEDEPVLFGTVIPPRGKSRQPIIPTWMRSAREARDAVGRELDLWWYRIRYHAWHSPAYLLRALRWAPAGAGRVIGETWRWTWHAESAPLRKQQAQPGGDTSAYLALHKVRNEHVRQRLPITLTAAGTFAGGAAAAAAWAPTGWLITAGTGLALLLGRIGRPIDRPIVQVAVTIERRRRLTALEVREALCLLGIAGLKEPGQITFPVEIHRDGPGQLARVNLPRGVEAVKVVEKRGALSSALRRPIDQVWPIGGPEHAGQLDLWVSYVPVSQMKPPTWSLTKDGARTSVFEPIQIGFDQRQRPVEVPLFELNWLIGGQPGSGKSYFQRAIALGAALDPAVEFLIAEFKGTGDFMDFDDAGLCTTYVCGVDDEEFDQAADILAWALAECARRGKRIKKFRQQGRAPKGKATPELAAEPGSGLHPVVIVLDEVHELFLARPEAAAAAERIIKRGRALNIILLLATQIPDKDSLPKNITRCAAMRACLSVDDYIANDMILGTGAHKRGVTGTTFRKKVDAGWAMVVGLLEPTAVRAAFPTEAEAAGILARAVQLRGGILPGRDEQLPRWEVLVDVLRVWPAGQGGIHWETLAARLADARPELYADMSGEALSALLRSLEVPSVTVTVAQERARGCRREAVEAAMARREVTSG
jgi:S-DNA-T family DNA segregation ATPase FtsK/SpoIIIE